MDGVTVHRINEKGVDGIWACNTHHPQRGDGMSVYVKEYCPHCCPGGITITSSSYVAVRHRYCERYWELIDAQQERNRGRVMWQEQF